MAAHVNRLRFVRRGAAVGSPAVVPVIAGVREAGFELAGEPVDVTNNDDSGWRTLLDAAAVSGMGINVSGVRVNDTLLSDMISGAVAASGDRLKNMIFEFALESGETTPAQLSGSFYLSSYNETGSHDGETTFDATFMSSGTVTYTAGS